MNRNVLFCAAGVVVGFLIGFFVANSLSLTSTESARPAAARPLGPEDTSAPLPPGHPEVGGQTGGAAQSPASAQTRAATEKADGSPRDFEAQMGAATALYQAGDLDGAARYLTRALDLRPRDPEALKEMGNVTYDRGDFVAAAGFYERALAQRPNDVDVRTDLGNTYFQRTPPDYGRAIAEYRKSLAIDPRHEKSWQNLAAAATRLGDKAAAREALARLESLNPQSPALPTLRQAVEALP